MTDPTQRQVDSDIHQSMEMFKRADVGEIVEIDPRSPGRVLLTLDGSSQDIAASLLAKQFSQRLGCKVFYCFIPVTDDQELSADVSQSLTEIKAEAISVDSSLDPQHDAANYDLILAAAEKMEAEMLIAPCPFSRDFESLGEDSSGTVVDVLTARSTVPVVVIRRPDATGRDPTEHLRIVLTGENPAADVAAAWAVGLARPGGRVELLLLVEESFYERFRDALHTIQPDVEVSYQDLENALANTYMRLHTALRHAAQKFGFTYELLIRNEEDEQPITPEDPKSHPALMVLGLKRGDHDSQAEVDDFIRRSPHPVLVASV